MTGSAKRKGDKAELDAQAILRERLGVPARRALGAGRADDIGDIHGVPDTVIQVVSYKDITRAIREKVDACEEQQERAGASFGATWIRRPGGGFVVAQTVDQWCAMWREATA